MRIVLLLAALTVVAVAASPAPAAKITGARYAFSASAGASSSARGAGELRKSGDFFAAVKGRSGVRTFTARVLFWSIDRRTPTEPPRIPKTTLVLTVRVTSAKGGCRPGTRGTATLVDWNLNGRGGRSSDRVRVRFPAGSCRALSGTWSNANGDRVHVAIAVHR